MFYNVLPNTKVKTIVQAKKVPQGKQSVTFAQKVSTRIIQASAPLFAWQLSLWLVVQVKECAKNVPAGNMALLINMR